MDKIRYWKYFYKVGWFMEIILLCFEIIIFEIKMEMVVIEKIILIVLGIVIVLENFVVVLVFIWNKSFWENIYYNLVIFLLVCDFIVGFNFLLYGNLIVFNDDFSNNKIFIVCGVYYCVSFVIY